MQTVTLRFHSLTELTTFSKMINDSFHLNSSELTISGHFSKPYISIAQSLFEATLLQS